MIVRHDVAALRGDLQPDRRAGRPIVLVPTMGALHEGHLSLVRGAREHGGAEATVVVSIFVNPAQFAPNEDFEEYPRELDSDLAKCEGAGADLVFAPETDSIYAVDASTSISENSLSRGLCGASRPGHFDGVCLVVAKLFNLVQPTAAVFGEKDFQQLAVIRRMVRDLDFPIEIIGGPIVREPDGLAMSSRNAYLSNEHRKQAVVLSQALEEARQAVLAGERGARRIRDLTASRFETAPDARIDYLELVDPDSLAPIEEKIGRQLLIAVAVFFGKTRLIDNLCLRSLAE